MNPTVDYSINKSYLLYLYQSVVGFYQSDGKDEKYREFFRLCKVFAIVRVAH